MAENFSKVAIMQPTYLPWSGYFSLIDSVDTFVFLDDVQFSRRSWQQRNKIKSPAGEIWLTVPVISKGLRDQLILETKILNRSYVSNHISKIKEAYHGSKYFIDFFPILESVLERDFINLIELNISLIESISKYLNLSSTFKRSSEFSLGGIKDEKIFKILDHLKSDFYISASGSRQYMENSKLFQASAIEVKYLEYEIVEYHQLYGNFIPYMSIIDHIFNMGPEETLSSMRLNRKLST